MFDNSYFICKRSEHHFFFFSISLHFRIFWSTFLILFFFNFFFIFPDNLLRQFFFRMFFFLNFFLLIFPFLYDFSSIFFIHFLSHRDDSFHLLIFITVGCPIPKITNVVASSSSTKNELWIWIISNSKSSGKTFVIIQIKLPLNV